MGLQKGFNYIYFTFTFSTFSYYNGRVPVAIGWKSTFRIYLPYLQEKVAKKQHVLVSYYILKVHKAKD